MERYNIAPRQDWQQKVEKWGMLFHTVDDRTYWNESAYYQFTSEEIDELETATNELHEMCLVAVQHVIDRKRYAELKIPSKAIPAIEASWVGKAPSLYGRFDFGYDGNTPPKLLEYNADTPTSLLEAGVIQWQWMQEVAPKADQFNSIWEGLVEKWTALKKDGHLQGPLVHFAHQDSIEDLMTVTMLRDTAQEAGLKTEGMMMGDIGWNSRLRKFTDLKDRPMQTVFKLYPWEWMLADEFSDNLLQTYSEVSWIEPVWKLILSNKAILAILWELYPNHKYLLEAHLDGPGTMVDYVRKPIFSREGENVEVHADGQVAETSGTYGEEGYVYQGLCRLPNMKGNFPVLGCWVIDGKARGMGIREADNLVTDDLARFVPHLFS